VNPGDGVLARRQSLLYYPSDKVSQHSYGSVYEGIFGPYMHLPLNVLEIGLGCTMWNGPGRSYELMAPAFPNASFHWIEIARDLCVGQLQQIPVLTPRERRRLRQPSLTSADTEYIVNNTVWGDQSNVSVMLEAQRRFGFFDVIVDDGSHRAQHVIPSFVYLFPHALKPGGVYVIEDLQAAFWPQFGARRAFQLSRKTHVHFIQDLIRDAFTLRIQGNAAHMARAVPDGASARWVCGVHCEREICAIRKAVFPSFPAEQSPLPVDRERSSMGDADAPLLGEPWAGLLDAEGGKPSSGHRPWRLLEIALGRFGRDVKTDILILGRPETTPVDLLVSKIERHCPLCAVVASGTPQSEGHRSEGNCTITWTSFAERGTLLLQDARCPLFDIIIDLEPSSSGTFRLFFADLFIRFLRRGGIYYVHDAASSTALTSGVYGVLADLLVEFSRSAKGKIFVRVGSTAKRVAPYSKGFECLRSSCLFTRFG
jgi:hypothetical protein